MHDELISKYKYKIFLHLAKNAISKVHEFENIQMRVEIQGIQVFQTHFKIKILSYFMKYTSYATFCIHVHCVWICTSI